MILLKLFLVFFKVGLFAIGGAYSFLPLLEKEMVENYHWLSKEEFLDVLAVVKVFPGAISIKYASYAGYKLGGIPGVVCANLGNFLAPALLVLCASMFYFKYKNNASVKRAFSVIELVIFAMIIAVAFQSIEPSRLIQVKNVLIIVLSFALFVYTKIDPAIVLICAGVIGFFFK
ncbi:MAG TPA: chromate transporter [Candidatus Omnitrophica bacterium]|nr:chromate transporter [Candidatus Omnitrophota bacterium]